MTKLIGRHWLPEADEQLRQLWCVKGLSGTKCGQAMGLTRCAVIGRVTRLQLRHPGAPSRSNIAKQPLQRKPRRKALRRYGDSSSKFVVADSEDLAVDLPLDQSDCAVALIDLEMHHCRWPLGEDTAVLFCGAHKMDGHAYCPRHCRRAYQRSPMRIDDAERARRAAHFRKLKRDHVAKVLVRQ